MSEKKTMPPGIKPTNYAADTCKTGFDAKNLGKFAPRGNSNHNSSSKKY